MPAATSITVMRGYYQTMQEPGRSARLLCHISFSGATVKLSRCLITPCADFRVRLEGRVDVDVYVYHMGDYFTQRVRPKSPHEARY